MKRNIDPTPTPSQREADDLALQCHTIVEILRRKRLACKLLRAALDGLRLVANYKDPVEAPRRATNGKASPGVVVGDILKT